VYFLACNDICLSHFSHCTFSNKLSLSSFFGLCPLGFFACSTNGSSFTGTGSGATDSGSGVAGSASGVVGSGSGVTGSASGVTGSGSGVVGFFLLIFSLQVLVDQHYQVRFS
jgi:hypothetical protein